MPVDKLQRRQEIIDIIKVLCNDAGRTDLLVDMEDKVKALTCDDREGNGVSMLRKWDEENVDPFLVAGFIYANLDKDAADIKNAQRRDGVDVAGDMGDDYTSNFASVGVNYKENARFMTPLGYPNAAKGLNTYLDNDLYKDAAGNFDWSQQLPLLKRFAVANSVFTDDFADENGAKDFYDNLKQLDTGDCSTVSSVRKTLLAAASLKAGFSKDQTETILDNVDYGIDNQYTADRAEVFKGLCDEIIAPRRRGVTLETATKQASIIFDSKKVSQDIVNGLKGAGNAAKRTVFIGGIVGINGDAPEGRNKIAFAAALTSDNHINNAGHIVYFYNHATDIFSAKNAKDFEYSSSRAKAFMNLWGALDNAGQLPEVAIKKASVVFDSKKVSQDVVDKLENNDNNERTTFANAVVCINKNNVCKCCSLYK